MLGCPLLFGKLIAQLQTKTKEQFSAGACTKEPTSKTNLKKLTVIVGEAQIRFQLGDVSRNRVHFDGSDLLFCRLNPVACNFVPKVFSLW